MKKILFIALCLLLLVFCFVGCKQNGGEEANTPDPQKEPEIVQPAAYYVKDGASDYQIVVPAVHSDTIDIAVGELILFFREATGVTLPVIDDNNLIFSENSHYFSIGKTTVYQQSGLTPDPSLNSESVSIQTVEKSVFLCGGGDKGTLYSVYKLLTELFGYEYYGRGCYTLNRNIRELAFSPVTLTEIPTFEIRDVWGLGPEQYDSMNVLRLYHENWLESYIPVVTAIAHNCILYVRDEIEDHEAYWWNQNKTNICFTAHGDPEEYEALINCITNTVKGLLKSDLKRNKLLISLNDGDPMCNCDACKELIRTYGTHSASNILLCNDVRSKIEEWFRSEEGAPYYRDNFTFGFLAYMDTQDAPVVYNEATGQYEGRNGIKCDEGVCVLFAPIFHDYTRSIYDSVNRETYVNFKGWDALTDHLYYWGYEMNFQAYFAPYDTLSYFQEMARFCKECGVEYYFNEGQQCPQKDNTAWANLHIYLNSKIGWNMDSDMQALIEDFFAAFYGPASDTMYRIFSEMRVYTTYLKDTYSNYGGSFSCETSTVKKEFWSKPLLVEWINLFAQAYEEIEFLKEDEPALYQEYLERIMVEEACPLYLVLALFPDELNDADLNLYKERFYWITSTLNFIGDVGAQINETWNFLGINY